MARADCMIPYYLYYAVVLLLPRANIHFGKLMFGILQVQEEKDRGKNTTSIYNMLGMD